MMTASMVSPALTRPARLDADAVLGDDRRLRMFAGALVNGVEAAAVRDEHHVQTLAVCERQVLEIVGYCRVAIRRGLKHGVPDSGLG